MSDFDGIIVRIIQTIRENIRNDGSARIIDTKKERDFTDLVLVDGVQYIVNIRPHVMQATDCAAVERDLNQTLIWKEHADRYDGYHPNGLHVSTVRKQTPSKELD